jgi:hypothetical protein
VSINIRVVTDRMAIAQVIDAATFILFIAFFATGSIHAERNPLILVLVSLGGVQLVGIVKVGLALIVRHRALVPRELSKRYQVMRLTMLSLATASGIVGAGFNIASIVSSVR